MSISLSGAQDSASSSLLHSPSGKRNSSHHGSISSCKLSPLLQLQSNRESLSPSPMDVSGCLVPSAEDSGGPSGKVTESNTKTVSHHQNGVTNSCAGSHNIQGGRRVHATNANHLLNFHYDPVSRSQSRQAAMRRRQKTRPYSKDLFLQANYRFVVLDTGSHAQEAAMDPDKMLRWEDILCVRYSTPSPVQCPICLDSPLCPHITTCGHVFCLPCLLQYLSTDEEDHKGTCPKRCPLCFTMISKNSLCPLYIENVRQYSVGDPIEFVLVKRRKEVPVPSLRSRCHHDDPFEKFTFTSDVELSVGNGVLDLEGWLKKADLGLADDVEKLPYVCSSMEQLKQRREYWDKQKLQQQQNHQHHNPSVGGSELPENVVSEVGGTLDETLFYFYQAVDGQLVILHPLNMKCLLQHYGSYSMLPCRINGTILQLETLTQSESLRRRYRYLSHFSLTATFRLCEIDLTDKLHPDALLPFMDEIERRHKQRKQLARKEWKEKIKAEVSCGHALPCTSHFGASSNCASPLFSMDDFEVLGGSNVSNQSRPIAAEKTLFSNVTKLGFAAAHDSPPCLRSDGADFLQDNCAATTRTPSMAGKSGTPSFAKVATAGAKKEEILVGKKGKKPNRVVLSSTSSRRY